MEGSPGPGRTREPKLDYSGVPSQEACPTEAPFLEWRHEVLRDRERRPTVGCLAEAIPKEKSVSCALAYGVSRGQLSRSVSTAEPKPLDFGSGLRLLHTGVDEPEKTDVI
ncbi:hypothetical protein NDU88_001706 [Pleurodeles waltl]|uniref:Uncharacterized protein n=1 Tax=Pleurodeles waltl TaxID=8319 RepID=A0AAV7VX92_PLEWA|nr:hypothetical protein NDU88_001706 [Pleurodeles waltl]